MLALLLISAGVVAGGLGALLGVGGGILLVPALVLWMGVPLEQAVPASLLCVVATSCGAAATYVERHVTDVRVALTLELATVGGAIVGGLVAGLIAPAAIALIFGLFAFYVAGHMLLASPRPREDEVIGGYSPRNYPLGVSGSFVAGGLSAVLGVGGGPLKVPLMNLGMGLPFKVASATSNLMIGVTAAASVAAYAVRGQVDLSLSAPLVVGVLGGASLGSRVMVRLPTAALRRLFSILLVGIAAQMLWKGGMGLWPNP